MKKERGFDWKLPITLHILLVWGALARAGEKGVLPEVVIKEKMHQELKSSKPKLVIVLPENKALEPSLKTEEELFKKNPPEITQWKGTVLENFKSSHAAAPWRSQLAAEPVAIFYPLQELERVFREPNPRQAAKVGRWDLVISGPDGRVFKSYSGAGMPPGMVVFDGKNEKGVWIKVGSAYSAVLSYLDSAGRSHTVVSRPLSVGGLARQENKGFMISLDFRSLFEDIKEPKTLSEMGRYLLQESADLIKRFYPDLRVTIEVYTRDPALSLLASNSLSERLSDMLKRPKEDLSARVGDRVPISEERVEIVVVNR